MTSRVLFVCTANICRSAFAQVYAEAAEAPGLAFASAGTWGWDDSPMDPLMAGQLLARGIDPTGFRSHQVTASDIAEADVVLTMEERQRRFLLDDYPVAAPRMFTLGQVARRVASHEGLRGAALLADLAAHRRGALLDEDVPDPYRRGPAAAEACATRLTALLDQVLPALP